MLLNFTSWLAWMPDSIWPTKFRKGLRRPMVTSEAKRSGARAETAPADSVSYGSNCLDEFSAPNRGKALDLEGAVK
jgi:hypothetical protein